jgi:hypothetical protein
MDVGAALREARQQAGLSPHEVSQRTKIQLAKIEALEANAFERLPEGKYLDGLLRAYATEVGLNGNELVARFRTEQHAASADQFDRMAPVEPPRHVEFDEADVLAAPPVVYDEPLHREPDLEHTTAAPTFAAYTTPPPANRGLARVAVPLLALLAAIGLGAYLYETTRPFPARGQIAPPAISHDNATAAVNQSAEPTEPAGQDAVRTARETTPRADITTRGGDTAMPRDETTARSEPKPSRGGESVSPEEASRPSTASHHAPKPLDAPDAPSPSTATRNEDGTAAVRDLSGYWTLDTRVESSSMNAYEGLQLGYRLQLQQSGNRISGDGVKTLENGRALGESAQTPIAVHGTLDGTRLTLTFTERGRQRETGGKMILDVQDDGVMRGRFSSSAAGSAGTAEARRPEG